MTPSRLSACGAAALVVALSHNQVCEEALGRIGTRFAVRRRADGLEVLEGVIAADPGDGRAVAYVPPCRTGEPGRRAASRPITGSATPACRVRWPMASARSRSSRRWAGRVTSARSARRGWPRRVVEQAIDRLGRELGDSTPYAMNLIHSPGEPGLEAAVVDLYLRATGPPGRGIGVPEPDAAGGPLSRHRASGETASGRIVAPNRIIAKVSRVEVASKFMAPPPERILRRAGRGRRDHARAGGMGGADPDGPGHHRGGRLGRSHRQPAGDRPAADDAGPPRSDASRSTGTTGRCGSARRAASRRPGRRRRRWRWGRPTS